MIKDILQEIFDLEKLESAENINDRLRTLSVGDLSSLHLSLLEALPSPSHGHGQHRFVANSESSGLGFPCGGELCRIKAFKFTSEFSALYSDETVVFNPFAQVYTPGKKDKKNRTAYADALSVPIFQLATTYPLIDAGILKFYDFDPINICASCFSKGLKELHIGDEKTDLIYLAADEFLESAKIYIDKVEKEEVLFRITNVERIYRHREILHYHNRSEIPASMIATGKELTREEMVKLNLAKSSSTYLVNDLVTVTSASKATGISNSFTTTPQVDMIRRYFGEKSASSSINMEYAMANNLDYAEAIKFRQDNWHHLVEFRNFADALIRSGDDASTAITSEFSKIEKALKKHRNTLNKKIYGDLVILSASAGTTIVSSGVSNLLATLLAVLGTGHLAKTMIPNIIERFSEPSELQESKVYYAWKAKDSRLSL